MSKHKIWQKYCIICDKKIEERPKDIVSFDRVHKVAIHHKCALKIIEDNLLFKKAVLADEANEIFRDMV